MASIKKRDNGKWRARYRDEAGVEHARHFTTKTEGQRWLDEVTASIVTGAYVDPRAGRITFNSYFEQWLGLKRYEDTSRRAVVLAASSTPFGDVPMRSIRRRHIESWVTEMQKGRGLAPGTISTRFWYVRGIFQAAVGDRMIPEDPTLKVVLPQVPTNSTSMRVPTVEEVGRLLAEADEDFRAFVALCAFAGLRLGEAAAVRLDDVNFLGRTLMVRRQVQRLGGGIVEVRAPKKDSRRTVALPSELVDLLSAHSHRRCLEAGSSAYLFAGSSGQPPHQNTIGYRWRRLRAVADVGPLRLHDLRHFYASGLINAGCDVVTVQHALGHSKPIITLNTYSHLWPTAEDRTRVAASALWQQASASDGLPSAASD